LRDYYVSNDHIQGIFFILWDEAKGELITRFIKKEEINNQENWRKKGPWNKEFYSLIVEKGRGKETRVLLEKGMINIRKKSIFGEVINKRKPAERITFYLAPSVYKPF
jgi:hypothetical protein